MRFVDEYRDPARRARARRAASPSWPAGDHFKFMEVCGGHTHTIYRHGIEHLLPDDVELVHGPGCPVCVIPMGRVDDAIAVAEQPGVIFTSFGDMMRVPGGNGQPARGQGPRRRRAVRLLAARRAAASPSRTPDRDVVFFAVGFETTAPSTAVTLLRARRARRHELLGVLQPRHDRAADQGHPRVARPAARRLPRPRPRVDRGRATGPTGSCPSSTASRS